MTSDPTPAPDQAAPSPVVDFVVAHRQNVAWGLVAVGVVCFAVAVYFGFRVFSSGPSPDADKDKDNPEVRVDKEKDEAKAGRLVKTEHVFGGLAALMAAVAGIGTGAYLLARPPQPTEAARRTDARVTLLTAGGFFGLTLMVAGLLFLYEWFSILVKWIDERTAPPGAYKVVAALLGVLVGAGLVFATAQPARAEERNNSLLRRLVYGINFGLAVLLLLLALVVGNVFAALKVPNKLDTTESGFYTLSDATRDYLATLSQPVKMYAALPSGEDRDLIDARQVLNAFQEANPRMVQVRFLDPVLNQKDIVALRNQYPQADLSSFGVLLTTGEDGKNYSFVRLNDFFDTTFDPTGRNRKEVFQGESKLIRELMFLAENKVRPVVYFTTGHGEPELTLGGGPDELRTNRRTIGRLRDALEKGYVDARPLAFDLKDPKVPDDAGVVAIVGPTQPFSEPEAAALRKYLTEPRGDKKGKLILASGPFPRPDGGGVADTGLELLLMQFGVRLGKEYILGQQSQRYGFFEMPTAVNAALAESGNPIALDFADRAPTFTNCREVLPLRTPGGPYTAGIPFVTVPSRITWLEEDRPTNPAKALADMLNNRELMVQKRVSDRPRAVSALVSEGGSGRVAVYGSGEAFADPERRAGRAADANAELFAATVNWLRDRPAAANEANKTYETYTLNKSADSTRLFWLPIGITLLGVLALGFGVWVFRRK
jgi:hypothetical protein